MMAYYYATGNIEGFSVKIIDFTKHVPKLHKNCVTLLLFPPACTQIYFLSHCDILV